MDIGNWQLLAMIATACFTLVTAAATSTRAFFAYKQYKVEKEKLELHKEQTESE